MDIQSAFNSSLSGLTAQGQAISVVSDNIANAQTTAFKETRAQFDDIIAQGTAGSLDSMSSQANTGNGVRIGQVQSIFINGGLNATGRELDVAINGNGFLVTGDPATPTYTRDGNLSIDQNGFLQSSNGDQVYGYQGGGTSLAPINMKTFSKAGVTTSKVSITGNLNASQSIGTPPASPTTFSALNQAATFVTQASVYDSLGAPHTVELAFTKTGVNTWVAQAYTDAGDTGGTAGTPVQLGANTTLTFGADGVIADANKAAAVITATPAYSNGAAAGNFTIDLSGFNQFSAESEPASVSQDGVGAGEATSYNIGKDGVITAQLSSGSSVQVGQIALANFTNLDGLTRVGSNGYSATANAGSAVLGTAGLNGLGSIEAGTLENSTVDLAGQFVNLVLFQRGYQASSQTLNVVSQLEHDTIGLMK